VEFLANCIALLDTGEWKIPEEVVHQMQKAVAQQWYGLA
jgi:hypothetical protein